MKFCFILKVLLAEHELFVHNLAGKVFKQCITASRHELKAHDEYQ